MSAYDNNMRCCACAHHKTKHRYGWRNCRVNGCSCEEWQVYTQAEKADMEATAEERRRRYQADVEKREAGRAVDVHRYDSFAALVKATNTPPINPENNQSGGRMSWRRYHDGSEIRNQGQDWSMGKDMLRDLKAEGKLNLSGVTTWIQHGWEEGVTRMRGALGQVQMPALSDIRRRGVWSDIGDELSLDRLYSGSDTPWRYNKRAIHGAPPRLQIMVQATMSYVVNGENGFWRGAAATALAEAAVAAGYMVAVDTIQAVGSYTNTSANYLQVVRVKDYDSPINVNTLISLSAHPAMLRVITFAHGLATAPDRVNGYFGFVQEPSVAELRRRRVIDDRAVVLIVPQGTLSEQRASAWLAEQVSKLEKMLEHGTIAVGEVVA